MNGRHWLCATAIIVAFGTWCAAGETGSQKTASKNPKKTTARHRDGAKWISLFDGKTLKNWNRTQFGGEGDVYVKDGQMILEMGADLTGVTWKKKETLPRIDYEVTLDAKRVDGTDFFCALTFPVNKDACSLVLGGWGGGLCGLSSIDGMDASENDTTTFQEFKNGQWYRVRLRVMKKRIQAWLDKEQIVDADITGSKISVRIEVELSRPFGIATWQTTGAIKNIRIRKLKPDELVPKPAD